MASEGVFFFFFFFFFLGGRELYVFLGGQMRDELLLTESDGGTMEIIPFTPLSALSPPLLPPYGFFEQVSYLYYIGRIPKTCIQS